MKKVVKVYILTQGPHTFERKIILDFFHTKLFYFQDHSNLMCPYYKISNKNKIIQRMVDWKWIYICYDRMINLVRWQPSTLIWDGKHFCFLPTKFQTFSRLFVKFHKNIILFPGLEKYFQFQDFFLFWHLHRSPADKTY